MQIFKWYSVIFLILSLVTSTYENGKKDNGVLLTILSLLFFVPIIVYLILS